MSDLAKEILNAPLGTILILAGLAFLAIGIVGKIKGKIEPGTWGRVLAGIAGLVFLGIGLAMHLGGEEKEGNDEEPEKLPTINLSIARFSADPLRIQSGEQSTLSWETRNASEVTIEGIGDVAETGSTGVSPRRTTTYELTASDGAGGTKTARLTVQVSKDTTEASAPTISAFVVKPDQIKKGECTLLGWRTSGAVSVELRPGGTVALSGSQEIRPLKSTPLYPDRPEQPGQDCRANRHGYRQADVQFSHPYQRSNGHPGELALRPRFGQGPKKPRGLGLLLAGSNPTAPSGPLQQRQIPGLGQEELRLRFPR